MQNYVFVRLHCSHLETVLIVAPQFIGIDHFVGLLSGKFVLHSNHICHFGHIRRCLPYVAQNDGPMADNEKSAAYYVKVVDASFPHFHGTLNLLFSEVMN